MNAVDAAVPPSDANPRLIRLHRWRVTLVACGAFCGLAFFVPLSFGTFPKLFPGFATRADIQAIITATKENTAAIRDDRESTLDQQIFSLRVLNCQTKDDTLKQQYLGRIQDLLIRYRKVSGQSYSLPSCGDL